MEEKQPTGPRIVRTCTPGCVPGRLYLPGPDPLDPPMMKLFKAWHAGEVFFPDGEKGKVSDYGLNEATGLVRVLVYVRPGRAAKWPPVVPPHQHSGDKEVTTWPPPPKPPITLWKMFHHLPQPSSTSSAAQAGSVDRVGIDIGQCLATEQLRKWRTNYVRFPDGQRGMVTECSVNNDTGDILAMVEVPHCLAPRDAN